MAGGVWTPDSFGQIRACLETDSESWMKLSIKILQEEDGVEVMPTFLPETLKGYLPKDPKS